MAYSLLREVTAQYDLVTLVFDISSKTGQALRVMGNIIVELYLSSISGCV